MDAQKIIAGITDLPTLPSVALRINDELNNESLTAKKLAKIISADAAFASKILRIANSAFYGLPTKVGSVEKAVMLLGFNMIKNLALSLSIYKLFNRDSGPRINIKGLWEHSLGCAVTSKILAEKKNKGLGEDVFLLGILHDIGKLAILKQNPADMEKVQQLIVDMGVEQAEAESEILGCTHQKIGTLLLRQWKFPESIIAGVRLHHNFPPYPTKIDQYTAQSISTLVVGNQMSKALSLGQSLNPKYHAIPPQLWAMLNVKKEDMPSLCATTREQYGNLINAWSW